MTVSEADTTSAAKLHIHQALVNRIAARAVAEGSPLTPLELEMFESDSLPRKQAREFSRKFDRENNWQGFLDRVSGLLRNAIAEDTGKDPEAPHRYDAMVHEIEERRESFTLWACCVPAIPHYKSDQGPMWARIALCVFLLLIVTLIVVFGLKKH